MPTTISELLAAAARQAVPVVRGVGDHDLAKPTPCADYTVGHLLNHFFHVVVGFQARAAKAEADFTDPPDYLRAGWRDRFATETDRLVTAWAAPGAEEGSSGAMNLPARTLGRMALLDLTVHPWDLARATGQQFRPDPAGVTVVAELVREVGAMARQWKVFGDPVPPPPDASEFEALLAGTGRDPHWTP